MRNSRFVPTLALVWVALVGTAACSRLATHEYILEGQILGVDQDRREILIKHGDIQGFMPGMTMPFKVKDWAAVKERVAGDLITATLVVQDADAYVTDIRKTGRAPLDTPSPAPTASGVEVLKPGEPVPDQTFVDENGNTRRLSDLKGRALAITFIYTRCPVPTFCPLMDRNFAAIQARLTRDARLRGRVYLLSVTFDPAYDTPAVLKRHATSLGADPSVWAFFTGDGAGIDRFGMRLGMTIVREADSAEIPHNLRTAIVDRTGTLVKVYTGVDWTPDEIVTDLAALAQS